MMWGCQYRDGNLQAFFQHENQACPPALSDGSYISLSAKNQVLISLEDLTEPTAGGPPTSSIVIDEQSSSICCLATAKNFQEYAQHIFIPMTAKMQHTITQDLVWDFTMQTQKGTAREKLWKGVKHRVV